MDSRIREIEQWVAEARNDLGECGQEAYVRKLFLLDAEIRAVIKETGILPDAGSPRHQARRVRRFLSPALALSGAAGAVLLTATTVYLSGMHFNPSTPTPPPTRLASADPGGPGKQQSARAYIPASVPGEEILPEGWTPPAAPLGHPAPMIVASSAVPASGAASQPAKAAGAPVLASLPVKQHAAAQKPRGDGRANEAVSVVLASYMPPAARPATANTPVGASSSSGGAFNATISRFTYFPEAETAPPVVNRAKEKTKHLKPTSPGSSTPEVVVDDTNEPVDSVDKETGAQPQDVDKLDPQALKDRLESSLDKKRHR